MFERIQTKRVIDFEGKLPATTAVITNNQLGKCVSRENVTILKEVFSATANGFGRAFYQPNEFTVFQDSYAFEFVDKSINISKIHYFITTSLNKIYSQYDWGNKSGWNKIKERYIKLPTKKGEIDFEFMESFVAELEARHVAELEAYLTITGLENYELTEKEEESLRNLKTIEYKKIAVKDLFEVNSSKKKFDANKVKIFAKGHPYIVRTANNNGVKGYLKENEKYLNEKNTISFGQDTATMFYQEKEYFTGDKIKILKCRYNEFNKGNSNFIITIISKSFSNFSWGATSFSTKSIENQEIYVPVKNGKIDFEFMELFISAIQKLVIKDVAIYAKKKKEATQEVINRKMCLN